MMQFCSSAEISTCSVASVFLPSFVTSARSFDFAELSRVVAVMTYNLNRVLDIDRHPEVVSRRPIGISSHGLAETFIALKIPFESDDARVLNVKISKTIYHAAMHASCDLVERFGVYEGFDGSPTSRGTLQPDLWGVEQAVDPDYDWDGLRTKLQLSGLTNSLLVALTSTSTTKNCTSITGSFDPITRSVETRNHFFVFSLSFFSNLETKSVNSDEYNVISKWLVKDLTSLGLWNEEIRLEILAAGGESN